MDTIVKIESRTEDGGAWLSCYVPTLDDKRFENGLAKGWLEIDDGRRITSHQRKFIYAIIHDFAIHIDSYSDEVTTAYYKGVFKTRMIELELVHEYFSLSNCTITTANKMIDLFITTAFDYNIPLRAYTVDLARLFDSWEYNCMKERKCFVCGKNGSDWHHIVGSKVQMGNNRNKIDNTDREFMCLCRIHHVQCEAGREQEFMDKHHIKPIKLNEQQVKELGL